MNHCQRNPNINVFFPCRNCVVERLGIHSKYHIILCSQKRTSAYWKCSTTSCTCKPSPWCHAHSQRKNGSHGHPAQRTLVSRHCKHFPCDNVLLSTCDIKLLFFRLLRQGPQQLFFHLHLFLTSASSSVTSATAISSLTASRSLLVGLPRFLFPGSSHLSILLPIYPSYFLHTCINHLSLASSVAFVRTF